MRRFRIQYLDRRGNILRTSPLFESLVPLRDRADVAYWMSVYYEGSEWWLFMDHEYAWTYIRVRHKP